MSDPAKLTALAALNIWRLMVLRDMREHAKAGQGERQSDLKALRDIEQAVEELNHGSQ